MSDFNQQNLPPKKWYREPWGIVIIFVAVIIILIAAIFGVNVWQKYQEIRTGGNTLSPGSTDTANILNSALFEQLLVSPNPTFGAPTAKIKIVEFADFSCSACHKFFPALRRVMNQYQNDIFVVFHNYLLSDASQKFAEAGLCANDQGKFWPLHDLMYQNQSILSVENIKKWAMQIGLDTVKFNACLDNGKYFDSVRADTETGVAVGVEYTPTLYINGYKLVGAGSEEGLKAVIEKILGSK
ncbi:MAG: thioredoxin domain-containing protein [Patescibacteria group bacterium]|nr:thioredoxin domain-containing protein [Patescibacteria group bacterium]